MVVGLFLDHRGLLRESDQTDRTLRQQRRRQRRQRQQRVVKLKEEEEAWRLAVVKVQAFRTILFLDG